MANTLIMVAMAPMLSAFLSAIFLKETPDKNTLIAILITFLSVTCLVFGFNNGKAALSINTNTPSVTAAIITNTPPIPTLTPTQIVNSGATLLPLTKIDWRMLENAIRDPFEDTIQNIRHILRNSRRITDNIRRAGINQPIAKIEWDAPNWPITTADIPANPPEEVKLQLTFPMLLLMGVGCFGSTVRKLKGPGVWALPSENSRALGAGSCSAGL